MLRQRYEDDRGVAELGGEVVREEGGAEGHGGVWRSSSAGNGGGLQQQQHGSLRG